MKCTHTTCLSYSCGSQQIIKYRLRVDEADGNPLKLHIVSTIFPRSASGGRLPNCISYLELALRLRVFLVGHACGSRD